MTQPQLRTMDYLDHILEAIERIHAYTEELDAVAFQENKLGSRCSDSKHRSSWRSSQ